MGALRAQPSICIALLVVLAPFVFGAASCGNGPGGPSVPGAELPVEWLVVGNQRITAEIASADPERRQGLMYRESIPEDHGMLFVWPDERVRSFWMRNTSIPLSIAFADAGGTIVSIADLEPFREVGVSSGRPARYALEANRGWFSRNGVRIGDRIAGIPH